MKNVTGRVRCARLNLVSRTVQKRKVGIVLTVSCQILHCQLRRRKMKKDFNTNLSCALDVTCAVLSPTPAYPPGVVHASDGSETSEICSTKISDRDV